MAEAAPEQQVVPLYSGQRAVVVGAGPAGSTAAMFLARQGFSVDVFERRPEPKQDAVDTGRAYIIILIPRGQAALKEVRCVPPNPCSVVCSCHRHGHCLKTIAVGSCRARVCIVLSSTIANCHWCVARHACWSSWVMLLHHPTPNALPAAAALAALLLPPAAGYSWACRCPASASSSPRARCATTGRARLASAARRAMSPSHAAAWRSTS